MAFYCWHLTTVSEAFSDKEYVWDAYQSERATLRITFAYTQLYTWAARDTVRVLCPTQEHNHYALIITATTSRTS